MKELRKIPTEKLGYRQAAAGPYLHVSARRGNKKNRFPVRNSTFPQHKDRIMIAEIRDS